MSDMTKASQRLYVNVERLKRPGSSDDCRKQAAGIGGGHELCITMLIMPRPYYSAINSNRRSRTAQL